MKARLQLRGRRGSNAGLLARAGVALGHESERGRDLGRKHRSGGRKESEHLEQLGPVYDGMLASQALQCNADTDTDPQPGPDGAESAEHIRRRRRFRGALQVDGVRTAARDARAILGELAYLFTTAGEQGRRRDLAAGIVQRAFRSAQDRWKLQAKAGGLLRAIGKTSSVIRRLQQIRRHAERWHDRWLVAGCF